MVESTTVMIEEREKEIRSIVQSITEINEMYRDLATLIVDQVCTHTHTLTHSHTNIRMLTHTHTHTNTTLTHMHTHTHTNTTLTHTHTHTHAGYNIGQNRLQRRTSLAQSGKRCGAIREGRKAPEEIDKDHSNFGTDSHYHLTSCRSHIVQGTKEGWWPFLTHLSLHVLLSLHNVIDVVHVQYMYLFMFGLSVNLKTFSARTKYTSCIHKCTDFYSLTIAVSTNS